MASEDLDAEELGQLVRDAGSVVAALAVLPVDEAADAALYRLFQEHAPRTRRRRLLAPVRRQS